MTCKWNTVAVVSDCTRVLGLGDIGPLAGMPVMEGKALIFKYLGGVDCMPICLNTKDVDEIVRTVQIITPSFGGINLEDFAQPKCFEILERLRATCDIPVWHDDQQGTAAVTLAGLINALKVGGKKIGDVKMAMIGAGAANIRCTDIIIKAGADPGKIVMTDTKGTLPKGRTELKEKYKGKMGYVRCAPPPKISLAMCGRHEERRRGYPHWPSPAPACLKQEWIRAMKPDPIVFVCANPVPECGRGKPKEAGAAVGRYRAFGLSEPGQQLDDLPLPCSAARWDVRPRPSAMKLCTRRRHRTGQIRRRTSARWGRNYLIPGHGPSGGIPARIAVRQPA
jgi:malate dehydrogenase (oxaloacetate-decarboxylating)